MLGTQLKAGPFLKRVADDLLRIDPAQVQALADVMFEAYNAGRMIFLAGNGGSANAPSNCPRT
jgi:D-sedoheptulose 7-phosphate isomerase